MSVKWIAAATLLVAGAATAQPPRPNEVVYDSGAEGTRNLRLDLMGIAGALEVVNACPAK
jgi:hypothetical protein